MTMNKTQANILMQQIRAENKNYRPRHEPFFVSTHRDSARIGKKIFK